MACIVRKKIFPECVCGSHVNFIASGMFQISRIFKIKTSCQAEIYRKQVETLKNISYVEGMTPWILYDFRCPRRVSVLQNYYNLKGLCSADKTYKKMAFYVLQDFYKHF